MPQFSRRGFLVSGMATPGLLAAAAAPQEAAPEAAAPGPSTLLAPDFRKLVSRADLHYTKPVGRSKEGQPVGNGRMGSLVWTTPYALKFQLNRVDVSHRARHAAIPAGRHTDYGSGCGIVDIDFVGFRR